MAVQLLSKSAYARHRGCDEKAVRKAVLEGRISLIDGKIDPVVADIQWAQNTRARAPQALGADAGGTGAQGTVERLADAAPRVADGASARPGADPGYAAFRARREEADAQISEMNAAKMRGTMLQRVDVDRAMFEIGREVRDRLTSCARRVASEVASVSSAEACETILDREHRIVLEMLVTTFREKIGVVARDGA